MAEDNASRNQHSLRFGTKGFYPNDFLDMDSVFRKYGTVAIYNVGDYKTSDVDEFIRICTRESPSSLHIHRDHSLSDPYFSLFIAGGISSWEVLIPNSGDIKEIATNKQFFQDISDIAKRRSSVMPDMPWHVARNLLVLVPLCALSLKVAFPDFPYSESEILKWTLAAAIFNYFLAWVERKKWVRSVIIFKPSTYRKILSWWRGAFAVIVASVLSGVIVELIKFLSGKI